jgi:uncharacterized protein YdaT
MPWTPKQFRDRHNKKLTPAQSRKAATIANGILESGGSESLAIRTANARMKRKRRK